MAGECVVLAETKKAAHSVIGAFLQLDANILVQQFVLRHQSHHHTPAPVQTLNQTGVFIGH